MKECSKFVCINANNINILIPSSQVTTSVYCNGEHFFFDGKFIFENDLLPFIDFYNDKIEDKKINDSNHPEIALIIKNSKLFDEFDRFALITSKKCSVMEIKYKDFSLFSNVFERQLKNKGFVACLFNDNNIYYLVDIEVFIKNFLK